VSENLRDLLDQATDLVYGPDPAQALDPLDRCIAAYDAQPDPDLRVRLLDTMGCPLLQFGEYPSLPKDRTLQLLEELDRYHGEVGDGVRIRQYYRWMVAHHLGDEVAAEAAYRGWISARMDEFDWCLGCEQTDMVKHLVGTGRLAEAVKLGERALASQVSCEQQPDLMRTLLLPAYIRLGRRQDAIDAQLVAYELMRDDPDKVYQQALQIRFCALTGNLAMAEELISRHGGLDGDITPYDELLFSVAVAVTRGGGEYAERATRLAASFDRRNGNGHQGGLVARMLAEQPWVFSG